jgi:hypothetical protein
VVTNIASYVTGKVARAVREEEANSLSSVDSPALNPIPDRPRNGDSIFDTLTWPFGTSHTNVDWLFTGSIAVSGRAAPKGGKSRSSIGTSESETLQLSGKTDTVFELTRTNIDPGSPTKVHLKHHTTRLFGNSIVRRWRMATKMGEDIRHSIRVP